MGQITLFDYQEKSEKANCNTFENWLLVDGDNILNRTFHATKYEYKTAPDGRHTNGVSAFLKMVFGYQRKFSANIVVFFDQGKGFRKELYPEYKDGRKEKPEELIQQFPTLKEVLLAADIPSFESDYFEADDLIASSISKLQGHKYILSNDKDLLQLVSDDVTVIRKGNKNVDALITPETFTNEYPGMTPLQIVDIKALAGDTSDNIKGVPGIGEKGAFNLVQFYGTVENMLVSTECPKELKRYFTKLMAAKEDAIFSKMLTTLRKDASITIQARPLNENGLREQCDILSLVIIKAYMNLY
ncbi:5'-3' exonuclease [Lysinibacillus fusiformis]|uniref:5'-3' exonuclease n=1 Tax=Lysinibacillus fusiformis TaxID=28031 RepID=UPI0021BF47E4|nr:5'-3' exonuclease [Lysinibacillus fusiformis]UXJ71423.1 5'-3' exonuclease [Lysinibacillus fusiformis]